MKNLLFAVAFAIALPGLAAAEQARPSNPVELGLSKPVVALVGIMAKNQDALKLDDKQKQELKAWLAVAPGKRQALEDETVSLRAQLRDAIVASAPVADRQALADKIGANETKLVMMRSNCADHWRGILSAEQFGQLLKMAGVAE